MYICRVEDRIGNGYTGRAAGGLDGRADRVRVELNGNPVQSGGLNRERLYRAGFNPPQAELNGRERDRDDSLNSNDQNRRLPNVHLIF